MKILYAVFSYYPAVVYGGPTINVHNLSRHFLERGHEVTIYCTNYLDLINKMSNTTFEKREKGVRIIYFNSYRLFPVKKGRHGLITTPDLINKFDKDISSHDIIHIHGYRNFLAMMLSWKAMKFGIPYIIQARGSLVPLGGNVLLKKFFDFFYGKFMLKKANKVIALTNDEKNLYLRMGVKPDCIDVIPNGLDIESIYKKIKPGAFRKSLGISSYEKIILFVGRINKTKGVDLLVKAFAKASLDNTRLVIVGPDDGYLHFVKKIIKKIGIDRRKIIFTGPIYGDDKYSAYHDADVFVRSSYLEGMPMGVIEALICGTPVIITKQCGLTDIVDKKVGVVVEYDEKMLTVALKKIIENDSFRNYYIEKTKEISKNFDINNVVDRLEKLYFSL